MIINDQLKIKGITKYKLSKISGVPQATINDICSGKADVDKCSARTLYLIARALDLSVEEILESGKSNYRPSFETFKSNTCHQVKDMGDVDFILNVLETDKIRILFNRHWYPEALYLLAMLDYLSRINEVPICTRYDDLRTLRLSRPVYSAGVVTTSKVLESTEPMKSAEKEAIPEFLRFNIIESEVRLVV